MFRSAKFARTLFAHHYTVSFEFLVSGFRHFERARRKVDFKLQTRNSKLSGLDFICTIRLSPLPLFFQQYTWLW